MNTKSTCFYQDTYIVYEAFWPYINSILYSYLMRDRLTGKQVILLYCFLKLFIHLCT